MSKIKIEDKHDMILALADSAKGKVFSTTFIKKDGTRRVMLCQIDKDKITGNSTVSHLDHLLTVVDAAIDQIRNINLDTVEEMTVNNVNYVFES